MIKVVHIAKPIAGVGVYVQLITSNINSEIFENVVLCNESDTIVDLVNDKNREIKRYHVNLLRSINPLKDIVCFIKIIKLLKKEKPNIIHCHSAKAGILGRLAGAYLGIPILYTPNAHSYLSSNNKFKKKIFKKIEKGFKILPSKILACSKSEYDRTIKELNYPKEKVLIWSNSIKDIRENIPDHFNYELPEKYICTIGRPSYQKNTELLIKAISLVKDTIEEIHLVIVGVGFYAPYLNKVEKLIKEKGLTNNITLIDFIDRNICLSILKKSKFFVSSSRYEGLPYAGIEALMLSKPCVLTNVDGNKDLIDDHLNGFLTNETSKDIADKIKRLYNDEAIIKEMSLASFRKFKTEFDIKKNMLQLEEIYKNNVKV